MGIELSGWLELPIPADQDLPVGTDAHYVLGARQIDVMLPDWDDRNLG